MNGTEKGKTYSLNCGTALLIKFKPDFFEGYTKVNINCGNCFALNDVVAELNKIGASINCGNMHIVDDFDAKVVDLGNNAEITGGEDYTGCFVMASSSIVIKENGGKALENAYGICAGSGLYYPEGTNLGNLRQIIASTRKAYPKNATPVVGDLVLTKAKASLYPDGAHIWVSGGIDAIDADALRLAREKNLRFTAERLFAYAGLAKEYGDMLTRGDETLVPDGYAITGSLDLNSSSAMLYGSRIYVRGDLTLDEREVNALEGFEDIIVEGEASLSESHAAAFGKVGKAKDYFVYKGRLWKINGKTEISRDQLRAATDLGVKYTLRINGAAVFTDDIEAGDAACIAALYYNGAIGAPPTVRAELNMVTKQANGLMADKIDGLDDFFSGTQFNTGNFMMI